MCLTHTFHVRRDGRPFGLQVFRRGFQRIVLVVVRLIIARGGLCGRGRIFGDLLENAGRRFFFGWMVRHCDV